MNLVIIESPYAGTPEEVSLNITYARRALRHSLDRGEAPVASHLLYTQVLDDTIEAERLRGIQAGHSWLAVADLVAFYVDRGWSKGMIHGLKVARLYHRKIEVRHLTVTTVKPPLEVKNLLIGAHP